MDPVNRQLERLIKDGYVFETHNDLFPESYPSFYHCGKRYFFIWEIESSLFRIHILYSFCYLFYRQYKNRVASKMEMLPSNKISTIELCENLIKEQYSLYENFLGEISEYNNPKYHLSKWLYYALINKPVEIIFFFVYRLAKQNFDYFLKAIKPIETEARSQTLDFEHLSPFAETINEVLIDFVRMEGTAEFERLFLTGPLQEKTYRSIDINNNIQYLKKMIANLERDENPQIEDGDENGVLPLLNNGNNLFCPGMPINFVTDHFSYFVNEKSKNGKPFLTQQQLYDFINKAFLGIGNNKKIVLNFVRGEKQKIQAVFYTFYSNSISNFDKKPSRRDSYIKLLSENFSDFPFEKIKANFSKHNKL